MKDKQLAMIQYLVAALLITMLVLQSCSKSNAKPEGENPNPTETETMKLIPDSMFRLYLKNNVCPNAFDKTGKFIDITHPEVKNFSGTMTLDTATTPGHYITSLTGIEYFNKMTKLVIKNCPIESLSLTKTMAVDTVRILETRDLQYVNVSGCINMRYLNATRLPVTSLDLSNLPAVEYISLTGMGRLTELKIENDVNLRHLMTFSLTSIKSVNVSTNPELRRLYMDYANALNAIDVTHNRKLKLLVVNYSPSLKGVDLSKNDELSQVLFDDSGIDTIDFSHNPQLISASLMRTPLRNLSVLSNPNLILLYLDGCTQLQTVDLRTQTTFDYWFVPASKYSGMPDEQMYERFQNGLVSKVQTADFSEFGKATRAGVNGATQNIFAGLRLPQYLDANGLSLSLVKINDAIKDNYSIVMARRTLGSQPALVTVYGPDKTTVLCHDYDPTLFHCNN